MLDAYVIGHGIPELAAALDLAEVGLRVRVALPADGHGAAVHGADGHGASGHGAAVVDGAAPDRGVPDPDGTLRAFLEHIAAPIATADDLDATADDQVADDSTADAAKPDAAGFAAAAPVAHAPGTTLLRGANGDWQPLPATNVWGLPAVPMASDSIALLGGRGALRASVDRVRPVLTIGKTHALGALVRSRMGQQMLDRVVNPLVRDRFGVEAGDVDVAVAAPGLNGSLTVAGSLSGAVFAEAEHHVARETLVAPAGGWAALREVLLERLRLYDVKFGADTVSVTELAASDAPADALARTARWRVEERTGETFETASIVVGDDGGRNLPEVLRQLAHAPEQGAWRPALEALVDDAAVPEDLVRAAQAHGGAEAHTGANAGGSGSGSDSGSRAGVVAVEGIAAGWTVRYESVAAGRWRVSASGGIGDDAIQELAEVREQLPALTSAPVTWQCAPWARVADRDAAAEALAAERSEHEWQLRVGRGVHAGDLATAVGDARQASILLRRRLAGISA